MEYYLMVGEERRGPYTLSELAARGIVAETLVMPLSGDAWLPAWQVEELRPLIRSSRGGASSPLADAKAQDARAEEPEAVMGQPMPEVDPVVQGYAPSDSARQGSANVVPPRRHHRGLGCLWVALIALLAVAGLLFATCPKPAQHKEAVAAVVADAVNETFLPDSVAADDPMVGAMRSFAGEATRQITAVAVDQLLSVDNYLVCSVGRIHYGGRSHVVSVGVCGRVFTVDKSTLKALARRYSQEAQRRLEEKVARQVRQNITEPLDDFFGDAVGGLVKDLAGKLLDRVGDEIKGALPDEAMSADSI